MGGLADNRAMTIVVHRRRHGTFRIGPIRARQIRRDDRVGYSAMGMIGLTVVMVRLRVNMYQRNGQHPGSQPREDRRTQPASI